MRFLVSPINHSGTPPVEIAGSSALPDLYISLRVVQVALVLWRPRFNRERWPIGGSIPHPRVPASLFQQGLSAKGVALELVEPPWCSLVRRMARMTCPFL